MASSSELEKLRKKIDTCDCEIIRLLNERFSYVSKIGHWKQENNQSIYVPERESSLIKKILKYNQNLGGELSNNILRAIYKEIMSGAIDLESPIKVAYLGPEGTFSHQAVLRKFGQSIKSQAKYSIDEVLKSVENNSCNYGVVPIENSLAGSVVMSLDSFINSNCKICSEFYLNIHHNLLSFSALEDIKVVYSHRQAIIQCRKFLNEQLPKATIVHCSSTAEAVLMAKKEKNAAAVAGDLAIKYYDLPIIQSKIEDNNKNSTRFVVVGQQRTKSTGNDKSSLFFSLKDKIGGLVDCLQVFKDFGINLTMIESRPSRSESERQYYFFIDFLGHFDDPKVKKCLEELGKKASFVKYLGSYPLALS